MSDKPKQATFFVQDPFTEDVQGPLTVPELKQWFAQGSVGEWGVSKSPEGPWTPASQVKGLATAKPPINPPVSTATPSPQQAVEQTAPSPAPAPTTTESASAFRTSALFALDWAKQHFPKSLIGRVLITIAGLWLGLMVVFGIGIWWSENFGQGAIARKSMEEAKEQSRRTWSALEQLGGESHKTQTIRDAEYERAKRELGR